MKESGRLAVIAAVGPELALGRNGDLVWHISADLKRFKQLTLGHPVVMGRKTWESLPKRPLPGRLNVVLSRSLDPSALPDGAVAASSLGDALRICAERGGGKVPFVIGGAEVYRQALPLATELHLTHVDSRVPEDVDTWFPDYRDEWILAEAGDWNEDASGVRYRFETWQRKN